MIEHICKTDWFETPSLLIAFPSEYGKVTTGRVGLLPGASLEPGKSSYLGPATTSGGSVLAPQRTREGDGVGIGANRS
jgi:hypothetical protein